MPKRKIRVDGRLYESVDGLENEVRKALEDLDTDNLVDAWNEFCESPDGFDDDHVYGMGQFDEDFDGMSPLEIAEAVEDTDFTTDDDYYYYTRNGNLSSTSSPEDNPIDVDWMVSHIVKSKDGLGNPDVQAVLDGASDN